MWIIFRNGLHLDNKNFLGYNKDETECEETMFLEHRDGRNRNANWNYRSKKQEENTMLAGNREMEARSSIR